MTDANADHARAQDGEQERLAPYVAIQTVTDAGLSAAMNEFAAAGYRVVATVDNCVIMEHQAFRAEIEASVMLMQAALVEQHAGRVATPP